MTNQTSSSNALHLRVPAVISSVEMVDDSVSLFLRSNGLLGRAFDIRLVTREAMLNAVTHGAASADEPKSVYIELEREASTLSIRIENPGVGFDHDRTPTIPPPTAEAGRGLATMHHYADDIAHTDNGRVVTLTFHLTDADRRDTGEPAELPNVYTA